MAKPGTSDIEDSEKHTKVAPSSVRELLTAIWDSGVWRLLLIPILTVTSYAILMPITPTLLTNFFAERRLQAEIKCQDYSPDTSPHVCQAAHTDVVVWSSWTSFFSNTIFVFLLSPLLGSLSDVTGRRPFLLLGGLLSLLPVLVIIAHLRLGVTLLLYYPANAIMYTAPTFSTMLAYVGDVLPVRHRAPTFGLIMASFSIGILFGPALAAVLSAEMACWVSLLLHATALLFLLLFIPESLSREARQEARERAKIAKAGASGVLQRALLPFTGLAILARSQLFIRLTICIMLSGIVSEGLSDMLMQFLQVKLNFGITDQAVMLEIFGVGALLVQTVLLQWLLGRYGEQRVLVLGLLASLAQQVMLALVATKEQAFIAISVGVLSTISFPAISSIKSANVAPHEQGRIQGALVGARSLAQGLGPLLFATIFAATTQDRGSPAYFPGAVWVMGAILMLMACVAAACLPDGVHARGAVGGTGVTEPLNAGSGDDIEALLPHHETADIPGSDDADLAGPVPTEPILALEPVPILAAFTRLPQVDSRFEYVELPSSRPSSRQASPRASASGEGSQGSFGGLRAEEGAHGMAGTESPAALEGSAGTASQALRADIEV